MTWNGVNLRAMHPSLTSVTPSLVSCSKMLTRFTDLNGMEQTTVVSTVLPNDS